MNDHSLRVLEFASIRRLLAEQTACALGRERALALRPSPCARQVRLWQQETTEATRLLDEEGQIPLGGIRDVREEVRAAALEATLSPTALLAIADTLAAGRRLREFLARRAGVAPRLAELAADIGQFPHLEEAIHAAIDEHAEVRDDASPRLAHLRREVRVIHQRMTERLQGLLRQPAYRDMFQDPVVTMRGDRYCLPIKSEYRSAFPGLVHDQSASGATVFMEPHSVVELGNELRHLQIRERQEVDRILRELSGRVGAPAPALQETLARLGELDFVTARARLSGVMDATEPRLNEEGVLDLRRARHPLLRGEVVPIDVRLGEGYRILVATGPNTGGKTVSLKTTGLLALMAQSGLHIPTASGSRLPVFIGIYADIGDEQSIEQSLSTFSGHITHIAAILRQVGEQEGPGSRSLVLLDEIGAGTDPAEGAALAKAILTHLLRAGVLCIATTHYGELKEFAHATAGVENASVEFDPHSLRPTYRLLIGIPGSSHAFTIARRLGLDERVLEEARTLLGTDRAALADIIEQLTTSQRTADEEQRRMAMLHREVQALREELERQRRQLEEDRGRLLSRARAEAEALVRQAQEEVRRVIEAIRAREKEVRRAGTEAALTRLREAVREVSRPLAEVAEGVAQMEPILEPESPPTENPVFAEGAPEPGDAVWVPAFGQRGTLLKLPDRDSAVVQMGALRVTVPYTGLRKVAPVAAFSPAAANLAALRGRARAVISPELHLRGQRAEEALHLLDEYLDDACLAGLSPVRVVHGKGTGALRRAVWDYLQAHPHVAAFRSAEEADGGEGVTVVELRE